MFADPVPDDPRSAALGTLPVPPAITVSVPVTTVGPGHPVIVFSAGDDEATGFGKADPRWF